MMPQSPGPDVAPDAGAQRHVFVYGTLRRGGRNDIARYRPVPVHVADASIAATLYDLGAYPGAVLGGQRRVFGEIYRVAPQVEAELDRLEGVADDGSGEYIRRHLIVAAGAQRFECLVYEIHPSRIEGRAVIDSGDWMAHAAAS
ncbi:gamma-glutamylcyclotransferase [Variovorax paradoxus]|nr:gamma-glutamylcyclotransferase family protein [Variovorax paradoxus]